MMNDFLQLCCQDPCVNDISEFFDTRPERREEGWYIELKSGFKFKIKDLGNGDILFCRPKTLYYQIGGRKKGKKFKTLVDAPVYNVKKIGPKELFERFKDFVFTSFEKEFPEAMEKIKETINQRLQNENNNINSIGGHD